MIRIWRFSADLILLHFSDDERTRSLEDFRAGRTLILISTMELQGICGGMTKMVVNYDLPRMNIKEGAELYFRRVGIAVNFNSQGRCINFIHNKKSSDALEGFNKNFQVTTSCLDLATLSKTTKAKGPTGVRFDGHWDSHIRSYNFI
ncbi:DEAD-domain-containing [Fusarium albosuccineum]|uniref:DEAD-domain-containing n=1 Tax=Fusarium albosuccineum TaxID=1237068 RepID=A0A8H4K3Y1_9HYPO|nr:DEAD-domain-containing [Fusarium albosuccineum]